MSTTPAASVVVRCKNEILGIAAALESLRAQTVEVEIIVVDSGSTDGTVAVAKDRCDRLIEIRPEEFSFGRALNIGAEAASAPVVFALSAHCVAADTRWVETSLAHYADPLVAGTCWGPEAADATLEGGARVVTFTDLSGTPHYGFSNHASSWRRSVWETYRFNEALASCEDKYWMWTVMRDGWKVVADPRLFVATDHRRAAGLRELWKREFLEHRVMASLLAYPLRPTHEVVDEWWSSFPWPSRRPPWQRRLSPYRTVEIVAGYLGERAGARARDDRTVHLPSGPVTAPPLHAGAPVRSGTESERISE